MGLLHISLSLSISSIPGVQTTLPRNDVHEELGATAVRLPGVRHASVTAPRNQGSAILQSHQLPTITSMCLTSPPPHHWFLCHLTWATTLVVSLAQLVKTKGAQNFPSLFHPASQGARFVGDTGSVLVLAFVVKLDCFARQSGGPLVSLVKKNT